MRYGAMIIILACAAVLMLYSACYESVGVTWYEAGDYKGPRDPLLDELENAPLQQQLEERVRMVQTDR